MTAPSAIGSENGTPSSRMSAPSPISVSAARKLFASVGAPIVRYATYAALLFALQFANVF